MSEMISVASGFQYSVNIGYDLNHDEKLQNFIPTKSSLELLQDVLESTGDSSTERSRVLVGAYGKGKSHIVLTILSLLMGKDWGLFTNLSKKIGKETELERLINNYYASGEKILPVVINGSSTSIQQSFLLALQKSLSENDLVDVMPETNYQAAIKAIERWKESFPDTYKRFRKEIGMPVKRFVEELENYDVEAYGEFEKVYPLLTSGSIFNPFLGFDVAELYESVVKEIQTKGYSGIYVIYDEFSKYLEANIKHASVSDTKMLQDFAEKCNRSGKNQLHLMLISHKEISNYIDNLPKQKVDGWRGVSERFKHIHLNNNFSQTYEIISSVMKKSPRSWTRFQKKYADMFETLSGRYGKHAMFSDMSDEDSIRTVYDCYPLHPATTFILPRLSERVAQNERTLFTFLSARGSSTLPSFLDSYKDDSFRVITPDMLFDYFEPLFRKESYSSELHRNYILSKTILEKLSDKSLESKIIKTLSLIYILEQFDRIKPTVDELYGIYSLDYSHEEIRDAIDVLINKEYVIYLRVSNDYLRLKQSSGVDVKQEIAEAIERSSNDFSVRDTLNATSVDSYMYPSKYNDEREMTRFFAFKFIDSSEVLKDVDWNAKSESIEADGVVYGIIPGPVDSIAELKRRIVSTSKGQDRYVFIIPKKAENIADIVLRFNAVMKLRAQAEGDDILFDEYEVIYEDLRDVITEYISSYTHPEYYKSMYIYNGKEKKIIRKAELSGLLSHVCEKVYFRTPTINNEAINKSELTGSAFTSRNKIITGLLRNVLEDNLGLTGTGQEVSIMRSTLIRKGILVKDSGITRINMHTGDSNLDYLLDSIVGFVKSAKLNGSCNFSELYYKLLSPDEGIGIRKSLIPIYLACVLHEYRQEAVLTNAMGQVPLSADSLIQIESHPEQYYLQYLDWDPEKAEYIKGLEKVFSDYIVDEEKAMNSYDYVVSAMKRWYMALPKYSKEKKPDAKKCKLKGVIRLLKQNTGSYELLFVKFPKEYNTDVCDSSLVAVINESKEFYDKAICVLVNNLIKRVKDIFSNGQAPKRSSVTSIVKDWCETLAPSVFEQLFDDGTDRVLRLFQESSNAEEEFIVRLAKLVTDLRIEDWDEKTVDLFVERLNEYKSTAENFNGDSTAADLNTSTSYSLSYYDETGTAIVKRFDKVEQTSRGKLLMNSLLSDIESMGYSITEQEKRQILMEILKKLC